MPRHWIHKLASDHPTNPQNPAVSTTTGASKGARKGFSARSTPGRGTKNQSRWFFGLVGKIPLGLAFQENLGIFFPPYVFFFFLLGGKYKVNVIDLFFGWKGSKSKDFFRTPPTKDKNLATNGIFVSWRQRWKNFFEKISLNVKKQ